jgi:hypothetical protein
MVIIMATITVNMVNIVKNGSYINYGYDNWQW